MATVKRPDGLYDVTDPYGGVALEGVPEDYIPQEDRGSDVQEPPVERVPVESPLYQPAMAAPPSMASQASAGPGGGEYMDPATPAQFPAQDVSSTAPDYSQTAVNQLSQQQAVQPNLMGPGDRPQSQMMGSPAPVTSVAGGANELSPSASRGLGAILQSKAFGAPGAYQKPGWKPQSTLVERPTTLSPEQKAQYEAGKEDLFQAQEAEAKAAEGLGDIRGAHQIESANLFAQRAQQAQADLAEHRAKAFEREQKVNARMGVLDNRLEQLRTKRAQFDPEKYWTDRGAFGSFLAKIGIALGAVGQGVLGLQSNPVQDQVNKEIDRNIEAQKTELEFLGDDVGQEYNILGQMRQNFSDQEAAELATRSIMGEAMAAQVEELGASAGSMEAQQNAKMAAAQIRSKVAENRLRLLDLERGTEQRRDVYGGGGMVGGRAPDPLGAIETAQKMGYSVPQAMEAIQHGYMPNAQTGGWSPMTRDQRAQLEYANNLSVRLPGDNGYAYAPTKDYAEKAQGVIRDAERLKRNYARQLEILEEVGHGLPWSDKKAEYEALVGRNRIIWKGPSSDQLGVIAGADLPILDSYSGAGGEKLKSLDSQTKARIRAGLDAVDQNVFTTFWELHKDPYRSEPILKSAPAGKPAALQGR